jgi:hypothetical protein
MPSDIAVGANINTPEGAFAVLPRGAAQLKKPPYLITLIETSGKTQTVSRFVSLDKPELQNGFIQVRGIFCDKAEDVIVKSFQDILTTEPKESILEMMFPIHRIHSIRSLVYSAVKTLTPTKQEGK